MDHSKNPIDICEIVLTGYLITISQDVAGGRYKLSLLLSFDTRLEFLTPCNAKVKNSPIKKLFFISTQTCRDKKMANLRNRFDQESTILETLFGKLTDQQWARLDFIYLKTEQDWNNTFKKIPDGIIRYLLICEAPPWSESGNINYVYNPSTPISAFLREPAKAFLGEGYHSGLNRTRLIEKLCRYGFMLVDSIPFAMNYSKNKRRDTDTYSQLVSMTVDSYLQEKLEDDRIKFAKDIKIAFALRKNADVISTHYSNNFPLASHGINSRVTENICTNAANYPCAERLREIFKLKNQLRTQRNSLAETDNL